VTVSGRVTITPTAAAATTLGISLPIASNFSAGGACAGTAAVGVTSTTGGISADTVNKRANLDFVAPATTARSWEYFFQYVIV
jgi:hypothetical protein